MRALIALASALRLDRERAWVVIGEDKNESSADVPNVTALNASNASNASNVTQDRIQPVVEEEGTALPEQACNTNLLLATESAWVSTCFHWDSQDPNIAAELRPWVDYAESSLTPHGAAQVCVEGEACIQAVHAYYTAFVEEGCAERKSLESTYNLAHALETAADSCSVVGAQAALNYTPPAVDTASHPNSKEGCFHSYPDCAPHCLMLPARPNIPGAQRMGELYYVHGMQGASCYRATTRCQGCLFDPENNQEDLQPWNCPDVACVEVPKYNEADAPTTTASECKPQCLGHPPCGPDGCGGHCGVCADNEECVDAACVWRTFEDRFEPKDDREVPEWFKDLKRDERQEYYSAARADELDARLSPFRQSSLAARLGIAPTR